MNIDDISVSLSLYMTGHCVRVKTDNTVVGVKSVRCGVHRIPNSLGQDLLYKNIPPGSTFKTHIRTCNIIYCDFEKCPSICGKQSKENNPGISVCQDGVMTSVQQ